MLQENRTRLRSTVYFSKNLYDNENINNYHPKSQEENQEDSTIDSPVFEKLFFKKI